MWKKIVFLLIAGLNLCSVSANILTRSQGETTLKEFSETLDEASAILEKRPIDTEQITPYLQMSLIPKNAKTIIIGDIHGDWKATKKIIAPYTNEKLILKEGYNLLCLGDFVDRYPGSIDVANLLLKIFVKNRKRTFIIQGNHETQEICGRRSKQSLRGAIKSQAKQEAMQDWQDVFAKAIYTFSLLPQAIAIGCTDNDAFYSFLMYAHAGPPGITIGKKGHYCHFQPVLKRFLSKIYPGKSGYCKTAIPHMHNWSNWTDMVASIPKDFCNIIKGEQGVYPATRGTHAQTLSHEFMKSYLHSISSKEDNFNVDAFICGHAHIPGGIVQLKTKLSMADLSPESHALSHDVNRSIAATALLRELQKNSWKSVPQGEPIAISRGDVFSCLSAPKPIHGTGAPSYAIVSFCDGRWHITHKMIK